MKRLLQFIMLFFAIAFVQACKGPEGDPGPQGEQGEQGVPGATGAQGPAGTSGTANVFDIGFTFNETNGYSLYTDFATINDALGIDITLNEGDIMLIYHYLGNEEDDTEAYMPLPETLFLEQGLINYNFYYTSTILHLFMNATFDFTTLEDVANYTDQQGFRIVIVPGSLRNGRMIKPDIDMKNYSEVAKYYNINGTNVKKINLN